MSLVSLLMTTVVAAETFVLPSSYIYQPKPPSVSFGQIHSAPSPSPAPAKAAEPVRTVKPKVYTVALLGDSMIETLGERAPDLASGLKVFFPGTSWNVLNYGIGATQAESAIERILKPFTYGGKKRLALSDAKPDLVIVESFAYNPYARGVQDLPRYETQLTRLFYTLNSTLQNVPIILAVAMAPDGNTFGDGAPGIRFTPQEKTEKVKTITAYQSTAVRFARSNNIPLADAYSPSLLDNGNGNPVFISAKDHIHYSAAGKMLLTQKIIETVTAQHLVK
jgi:lysophospholipase L1-like esterase